MKYAFASLIAVGLAALSLSVVPNSPGSYPGAGRIGEVVSGSMTTNGSAIAVSPTWVMTAAHVGGSKFEQDGVIYNIVQRFNHPTADIALCRVQGPLKTAVGFKTNLFPGGLPSGQATMGGNALTIAGYGWTGTYTSTGFANVNNSAGTLRGCRNALDYYIPNVTVDLGGGNIRTSNYIFYDLDDPQMVSGPNILGGPAVGTDEGGMSLNDSGCGWTIIENGRPKLVGIGGIIGVFDGTGVARPLNWGGYGGACILQGYEGWFTPLITDLNTSIIDSITYEVGVQTSGTMATISESDNLRLTTRTDTGAVDTDTPLGMIITSTSTKNAGTLKVTLEGSTNVRYSKVQVRMWNWATSSYSVVGSLVFSRTENTYVLTGINAAPYLNAQGKCQMNLRFSPDSEDRRFFDASFDVIKVEVL